MTKEGVDIGEMLGCIERVISEAVVGDGVIAIVLDNADVGCINDWLVDILTAGVKVSEITNIDANEERLEDPTVVDIIVSTIDIVEYDINDVVKLISFISDVMLSTDAEVDSDGEGEIVSVDGKEVMVTFIVDAIVSNDKVVDSDGGENIVSIIDITVSDIIEVSTGDAGVVVTSFVDFILSNVTEVDSIKRELVCTRIDAIVFI